MHEYSLAQALLRQVAARAAAHQARAVHRVTVRIGAFAGVEPELFATAFRHCRAGVPVCSAAELVLTGEAVAWRCSACERAIEGDAALACPDCGAPARLVEGDALLLERLELEVSADV